MLFLARDKVEKDGRSRLGNLVDSATLAWVCGNSGSSSLQGVSKIALCVKEEVVVGWGGNRSPHGQMIFYSVVNPSPIGALSNRLAVFG
jgi:hypothetical protein